MLRLSFDLPRADPIAGRFRSAPSRPALCFVPIRRVRRRPFRFGFAVYSADADPRKDRRSDPLPEHPTFVRKRSDSLRAEICLYGQSHWKAVQDLPSAPQGLNTDRSGRTRMPSVRCGEVRRCRASARAEVRRTCGVPMLPNSDSVSVRRAAAGETVPCARLKANT